MELVLKEKWSEGAGLLLGACWAVSCCGRSSGCAGVFWGMLCCSWLSAEWFCAEWFCAEWFCAEWFCAEWFCAEEPETPPACIGSNGDGAATGC